MEEIKKFNTGGKINSPSRKIKYMTEKNYIPAVKKKITCGKNYTATIKKIYRRKNNLHSRQKKITVQTKNSAAKFTQQKKNIILLL